MFGSESGEASRRVYPWLTAFRASPWHRTPRWAYYNPPPVKDPPKYEPFYQPGGVYGSIDLTPILTAAVQVGGSVASSAITATSARRLAAMRAARAQASSTVVTPSFQPSIAPAEDNTLLYVGGALAAAGILYAVTRKPR